MLTAILFLVNFIRTLLVIVVAYLLVRWIVRLFSPSSPSSSGQGKPDSNEGETTLRYNKKGEKMVEKDKGEYVDFEEID